MKALENEQKQADLGRDLILGVENSFFTVLSLREGSNSGPRGREGPRTLVENQESFWLQEPEDRVQGKHSHGKMRGESWKGESQRGVPQSLNIISAPISGKLQLRRK